MQLNYTDTASKPNKANSPPAEQSDHVQWLADWRAAIVAGEALADGSEEEIAKLDEAERLSIRLATVPAHTREGIAAQIRWFEEDLGMYIKGKADPAHDMIFGTLLAGVANIQLN